MGQSGLIASIKNSSIYGAFKRGTNSVKQTFYNCIPNKVLEKDTYVNAVNWIGKEISSPENRLILGVTALMSQPFIDANNKAVDEQTRKVSVCRTIAKIIAGTFTGVLIRYGCIKSIKAFSKLPTSLDKNNMPVKLNSLNTFFSPKNAQSDVTDAYKQYQNAFGTIASLVVMTFTNFLLDVPITKYLTNKFIKHAQGGKNETSS